MSTIEAPDARAWCPQCAEWMPATAISEHLAVFHPEDSA